MAASAPQQQSFGGWHRHLPQRALSVAGGLHQHQRLKQLEAPGFCLWRGEAAGPTRGFDPHLLLPLVLGGRRLMVVCVAHVRCKEGAVRGDRGDGHAVCSPLPHQLIRGALAAVGARCKRVKDNERCAAVWRLKPMLRWPRRLERLPRQGKVSIISVRGRGSRRSSQPGRRRSASRMVRLHGAEMG